MSTRLHERLVRFRWPLLALVLAHFIALHYFVIGIESWDGFGHRVPPVVELVKHGSLGLEKFHNWAMAGFRPFVELLNAPFLWVLGMDGLYFAFALTFPLFVAALYLFTREVTQDRTAALYAACVYVLVPVVNTQLFSGYVDWSVPGLLSFFLYALLSAERAGRGRWTSLATITAATLVFTMARQQAPYLSVFFFIVVASIRYVDRRGLRLSMSDRGGLARAAGAFVVGIAPAAILQILTYLKHGTPIYPYQFQLLGLRIGEGWRLEVLWTYAGLEDFRLRSFAKAFVSGWIWPKDVPFCFFDSRNLGAGLFFIMMLVTLPVSLRRANRATRVLLGAFVFTSIVGKDFWLPRYAYGLIITISVLNGLGFAALLESKKRVAGAAYVALAVVALLHVLRPEWDVFRIRRGDPYPRLNASRSSLFITGTYDLALYPDEHAQFVILGGPGNEFSLPLYGRKLSNDVITTLTKEEVGARCEGLAGYEKRGSNVLFVDDLDIAKGCQRTCTLPLPWRCLAYRIEPPL